MARQKDIPGVGLIDRIPLKSAKWHKRLEELRTEANQHHLASIGQQRSALDHAREAGKALLEAEALTGGRGRWSRWRRDNFPAGKGTSLAYMRIARHWDDPRLKELRARGINLPSIREFNRFLDGKPLKPTQAEVDDKLAQLRREFAALLKELKKEEVYVLADQFTQSLWPDLYRELQNLVSIFVDEEYYPELVAEHEENRRRANDRMKQARAKQTAGALT